MDITAYTQRRSRLLTRMASMGRGIAVIPTAREQMRNGDAHFPFRADSYFYYLSGFNEPEAVIVLMSASPTAPARSLLFCRSKNIEREIWDGFRWGPEAAREHFSFDEAYAIEELDTKLVELLVDQTQLWFAFGRDAQWDARITQALNAVRTQARNGQQAPTQICDLRLDLDRMRLVKDASEIASVRRAIDIAAAAHRRAMFATQPGRYEYEIEAELLHEFRRNGCQAPAYTSIVAGGANACTLHYIGNDQALRDGDLLLIDAGGELDGYAADITRTFPVNGRFSGPQADIYNLVLAAQTAAIAAIQVGASFMAPHQAALRVLAQGFIDLKLLTGTLDSVLETESYKRFYMHRTSHWLGLDVHDAGPYKQGEDWQTLETGMLLTVEPGCYIRPANDIPSAFHNIGVRIEDDALVSANGCEILSAAAPKTIADIETWMASARHG